MKVNINAEGINEAFCALEEVAYTVSNQGGRTRDFLLSFHDNRKVDTFGFVNLDRKLQKHIIYLIESHIHTPHCVAQFFKKRLEELSKFERL